MKEIFIDLSYEHGLKSMKIWRDQDMMRKDDTKLEIGQRERESAGKWKFVLHKRRMMKEERR